jgi:1-acyl-sn-glycerol-3-phosphate acyltransferase
MSAAMPAVQRTFFQQIWYFFFRLLGWKGVYYAPDVPKYVCIVAPHTSNFDFFIGFVYSRAFPMPFANFLAKDSVFKGIAGWFMRNVGGIPVNRRERQNFARQIAEQFEQRKKLIIVITPEGTRSKTEYWKSGFYHIAMAAKVPIVMGIIDYGKKFITVGPWIMPTGDVDADLEKIRAVYAGSWGRHPELQVEARFRPENTANSPADAE